MLQIKVVEHWILYKKVSRRIVCLSPVGVELRYFKDFHIWNIIKYKNEKVDSIGLCVNICRSQKCASDGCCDNSLRRTKSCVWSFLLPIQNFLYTYFLKIFINLLKKFCGKYVKSSKNFFECFQLLLNFDTFFFLKNFIKFLPKLHHNFDTFSQHFS